MAIVKREYTLDAFWNSNDLLDMVETALTDVGYHAAAQTGTVLTFTNTAGTTILSEKGKRYLVKQSSTSGSGVYSTWDVYRNPATGAISAVTLVNGGKNYEAANTITIAGADIGGATPTDNIVITASTVSGSFGTASTWYDKDTASPYTWGVCCVNNDETKKMGQTYYSFYTPANPSINPTLYMRAGAGFQTTTNVFNGVAGLDWFSAATVFSTTQQHFSQVVAKSNATSLRLVTFQSGVDSNFVVFQFSDTLKYGDVYRNPFFLSKYSTGTQPWSLDDCFTGSVYEISKLQVTNVSEAIIAIQTPTATLGKRQGEWAYNGLQGTYALYRGLIGYYESAYGKRTAGGNQVYPGIYQRSDFDLIHSGVEYNPVITGLPICNVMLPVPYFLPADFGIVEVLGTNTISHKDLLSVGATAKWRVLQYGNNQAAVTYNTAMAFVCKTVD
jgi:hypothetical protein